LKTYSDLLTKLDTDLREIDTKLGNEVFEGTVGWDKLIVIRAEKVKDRNQILSILGEQVISLKSPLRSATASGTITPMF